MFKEAWPTGQHLARLKAKGETPFSGFVILGVLFAVWAYFLSKAANNWYSLFKSCIAAGSSFTVGSFFGLFEKVIWEGLIWPAMLSVALVSFLVLLQRKFVFRIGGAGVDLSRLGDLRSIRPAVWIINIISGLILFLIGGALIFGISRLIFQKFLPLFGEASAQPLLLIESSLGEYLLYVGVALMLLSVPAYIVAVAFFYIRHRLSVREILADEGQTARDQASAIRPLT